jgi:hypothetical protein
MESIPGMVVVVVVDIIPIQQGGLGQVGRVTTVDAGMIVAPQYSVRVVEVGRVQ